jgi:integrase
MTLYELIDRALTTKQVMADGTLAPLLARSRRAPMRSAVKRYGIFLGFDPETAGPESYHRPDHEIKVLVDAKAPESLAANTRRNLANDLVALLRIGVDQGWLNPLPLPLFSWRERKPDLWHHTRSFRSHEDYTASTRYILSPTECPERLLDEIKAYLDWCEAPIARNRPRAVMKRPITSAIIRGHLLRIAGFAVHHAHVPADTLTLIDLCQLDLLEAFANWWLGRRGKMTLTLQRMITAPETIARYWLKDEKLADSIKSMQNGFPPAEAVKQKDQHWLPLETLEMVGQSIYPFNARRRQEYPHLSNAAREAFQNRHGPRRRMCYYVSMSLALRLLVRLPMRQRSLRIMQLGKNLYQDQGGVWHLRFVGEELKIDTVRGGINRYEFPFPADLVDLLEEWLTEWRPRVASPDETHVFLTMQGHPWADESDFGKAFKCLTYRFTGVRVTPHVIRDVWATEYLNSTGGDIAGCARRLGNTIQVVMQHYAHVINKDADTRAHAFLQETLHHGKGTSR